MEVLQADRPIHGRVSLVRNSAALLDGDTIRIDTGQIFRCDFSERISRKNAILSASLRFATLVCRFKTGEVALDGISFCCDAGRDGLCDGGQRLRQKHSAQNNLRSGPTDQWLVFSTGVPL